MEDQKNKDQMIFRVRKNRDYFVMANEPVNDENLSWGARGILSHLLSKPDSWQVQKMYLVGISPDGETKVRKYLAELKEHGYYRKFRVRVKKGKFRWVSEIYESPNLNPYFKQSSTTGVFTTSGKATSGKATSGKHPVLVSTDLVNTDLVNTDLVNTDGERAAAEILKNLKIVSAEMDRPIKAPETLTQELAVRGETEQTIKEAWNKCKANGKKPAAAFIFWIKSGHLPQNPSFTENGSNQKKTPPSSAPPPPPAASTNDDDEWEERLRILELIGED